MGHETTITGEVVCPCGQSAIGDLDAACTGYRAAIDGFVAGDMALLAHAARWRLGELLGGDEGTGLVAAAAAALRAEGIRDPARTVAVFVPVGSQGR